MSDYYELNKSTDPMDLDKAAAHAVEKFSKALEALNKLKDELEIRGCPTMQDSIRLGFLKHVLQELETVEE